MGINQQINKEVKDNKKENLSQNKIIGYFKIEKNNNKQRIINSFENVKREKSNIINFGLMENEEEIKDCKIYINGKRINFSYYYLFQNKGNYKIKYIYKKLLTSTNYMFYDCESLISLDLSEFNTQKVTNMESMFHFCKSLKSLNLSKFNTKNAINMRDMFRNCNSLISLDLSFLILKM